MNKNKLTILQILLVGLCFPIFYYIGKHFDPLNSFIFSFLAYWFLLFSFTVLILLTDKEIGTKISSYFTSINKAPVVIISFIPVIAVFIVVFLPIKTEINTNVLIAVLNISLFNGFFEEIFWRGLVVSKFSSSVINLVISLILFSAFHFAFLLLPLTYNGGALNLVGGAAFMSIIWLISTRITKNILFSSIAHVLVNFFAFSGLFLDNNLL